MGDTHSILLAILTVCCGGTVLASNSHDAGIANLGVVALSPAEQLQPAAIEGSPVTVARSADGLFYIDGSVSGRAVRFLIDTGANITLLAPADALRVGINPAGKSLPLETVNGTVQIAGSTIDRLDLAGHELQALRVGIAGEAMPVSLLGQDALSRLGAITIAANTLTIHPQSDAAKQLH